MKKLFSLATILVAATTLFACSKTETPNNETPSTQETQSKLSLQEVVNKFGEEEYIIFPLEISEEEAKTVYHIDDEIVEDYGISITGRQPGVGFAYVLKAKEGKLEEAKALAEQVKQDQIGNAFYPDEVEKAENAEILVDGNYVALLIFHDDVREDAINLYKELIK